MESLKGAATTQSHFGAAPERKTNSTIQNYFLWHLLCNPCANLQNTGEAVIFKLSTILWAWLIICSEKEI